MITLALFGLLCIAAGFAAGWIACWTAGLFDQARGEPRAELDPPFAGEWAFPPPPRFYDWDDDDQDTAA